MFSPVYEDVSALFGRPTTLAHFGQAPELQFPPLPPPQHQHVLSATNSSQGSSQRMHSQPQPQPQPQQQAGRATMYSLVDASGMSMSPPRHPAPASLPGITFNGFDGAAIVPYEVYMQQQQQLAAKRTATTTVSTQDSVKYFLSSATGTPVLAPAGSPPAAGAAGIMQVQQAGATLYAIDAHGNATPLTAAPSSAGAAPNGGAGSGDYSFFTANFLSASTLNMAAVGGAGGAMPAFTLANHAAAPPASRSRGVVNGSPAAAVSGSGHGNGPNSGSARRDNHAALHEMLATKATLDVFDPDFKFIYDVPTNCVVHLPPARLNITRLVLCRNYRPHEPQSCAMGSSCKFVHADCNYAKLEAHPIHVNYIWRNEGLCTYPRLPAGETLEVVYPDGRTVELPSEKVLLTVGAADHRDAATNGGLTCCETYENGGMCYLGERCNLIHPVHVDPNVQGDFKRAPRKRDNTATANSQAGHTSNAVNFTTGGSSPNGSTKVNGPVPTVQLGIKTLMSITTPDRGSVGARVLRSGSLTLADGLLAAPGTNSPVGTHSSASSATRGTGPLGGTSSHSTAVTPVDAILDHAATARLQEAVSRQLRSSGVASGAQAITPSFSIALTPYAMQTLMSAQSLGTLLYLPRGSSEATVLGPVNCSDATSLPH